MEYILLWAWVCINSKDSRASLNLTHSSNKEDFGAKRIKYMALKTSYPKVIIDNSVSVGMNRFSPSEYPSFGNSCITRHLYNPVNHPLLPSHISKESFILFLELTGDFISLGLLFNILNFDKKHELLDLYILLNPVNLDSSEETILDHIYRNAITKKDPIDITEIKRFTKKELLKVYHTKGFFANLISKRMCWCSCIKPLENILNEKFNHSYPKARCFIFSYLEYRPIVFELPNFTVELQFQRKMFPIDSQIKIQWALIICIIQKETLTSEEIIKVQPVIDLITELELIYFESSYGFQFYIHKDLGSDFLKAFLFAFVTRKNDNKTRIIQLQTTPTCFSGEIYAKDLDTVLRINFYCNGESKLDKMQIYFNFDKEAG